MSAARWVRRMVRGLRQPLVSLLRRRSESSHLSYKLGIYGRWPRRIP
jgi:hypothetical protein